MHVTPALRISLIFGSTTVVTPRNVVSELIFYLNYELGDGSSSDVTPRGSLTREEANRLAMDKTLSKT